MPADLQLGARLLTALEDLAGQEAASLAHGDWETLARLRQRAAPLVELLANQGSEALDAPLRARLAAWLARRQAAEAELSERIDATKTRLLELDASRRRVARVVPAYAGRPALESRRLAAVG